MSDKDRSSPTLVESSLKSLLDQPSIFPLIAALFSWLFGKNPKREDLAEVPQVAEPTQEKRQEETTSSGKESAAMTQGIKRNKRKQIKRMQQKMLAKKHAANRLQRRDERQERVRVEQQQNWRHAHQLQQQQQQHRTHYEQLHQQAPLYCSTPQQLYTPFPAFPPVWSHTMGGPPRCTSCAPVHSPGLCHLPQPQTMENASESSNDSDETYFSEAEKEHHNGTKNNTVLTECKRCADRQAVDETIKQMVAEQVKEHMDDLKSEMYSVIRHLLDINLRSMCEALDKRMAERIEKSMGPTLRKEEN